METMKKKIITNIKGNIDSNFKEPYGNNKMISKSKIMYNKATT